MNSGCDSLKNRPPAARLTAMYANQAYVPRDACPFKIVSINRVHEVSGHFFSSVLDGNDMAYNIYAPGNRIFQSSLQIQSMEIRLKS
jgi:hypothetical protein